jgi:hypothetical protein
MSSRTSGPIDEKFDMNDLVRSYVDSWCAYCVWCERIDLSNGRDDRVIQGYREDIRYCLSMTCRYWESRPCQKSDNKQQKDTR